MIRRLFNYQKKHWKSSIVGLIFGLLTLMLWLEKLTVTEWVEGIGIIGTVVGLMAKDWDKTAND